MITIDISPNHHPLSGSFTSNREAMEKEIDKALEFLENYRREINTKQTIVQDRGVKDIHWEV